MIKILHYYANKINMGDWTSAYGVQKMLREASSQKVSIEETYLFGEFTIKDVDYINEHIDVVVIGGGGVIRDRDNDMGWLWDMPQHLIKQIKKPIFLYAVGINVDVNHQKGLLRDDKQRKILEVLNYPNVFLSVRDNVTKEWADENNIPNYDFVPCPSLFVGEEVKEESKRSTFGINLLPRHYMPSPEYFEDQLEHIIYSMQERGFQPVFISTNVQGEQMDYELEMAERYDTKVLAGKNPLDHLGIYGSMSFTLVMRAHPILFSISQKTPFVGIMYNIKSAGFMDLFEYPYRIDIPSSSPLFRKNKFSNQVVSYFDTISEVNVKKQLSTYRELNQHFAQKIIKHAS